MILLIEVLNFDGFKYINYWLEYIDNYKESKNSILVYLKYF